MKKDLKHFGNKERKIAMIDKLMKIVIKAFTIVSFIGIILCIFTMGGYIPPICAMAVASIAWFLVLFSFLLIFLSNRKKKPESAPSEIEIRWISVEEALPPCVDKDLFLLGIDTRGVENIPDVGYLHPSPKGDLFISGELVKVTHWMYIPEIKKG